MTGTITNMYQIPAKNVERLRAEVARLNKRASKLNAEPVVLRFGETHEDTRIDDITGIRYTTVYHEAFIEGENPKLAGYSLAAVVTPQDSGENLVKIVPGEEVPEKYRQASVDRCDHCGQKRRRNDVFVLRHERGQYVQVGSTCLQDFLGGQSPAAILAHAEYGWDLGRLARDAEDEGWGVVSGYPCVDITHFVAAAAVCVRRLGWSPSSSAHPTKMDAWELCSPPTDHVGRHGWERWVEKNGLLVIEDDLRAAEKALEWARAFATEGVSDYEYNLGVACRRDVVDLKTAGIVASLIQAWHRHIERETKAKAEKETREKKGGNEYVGERRKRLEFRDMTVLSIRSFDSMYGATNLCKFETPDGNIVIWWATGFIDWVTRAFENGETVSFKATVKKHDEFKGERQTAVNRAAPID